MNNSQYLKLKRAALDFLLTNKVKEYRCHIQFVTEIAIDFARQFQTDPKTMEVASLFHDIGRGREKEGESHEETSARMAEQLMQKLTPDLPEQEIILKSIRHHNNKVLLTTTEEKILVSADGASKVIYHQAFMLMCKKEDFTERAVWGKEYLEKGMKNILYPSLREEVLPFYNKYRRIYQKVLRK